MSSNPQRLKLNGHKTFRFYLYQIIRLTVKENHWIIHLARNVNATVQKCGEGKGILLIQLLFNYSLIYALLH